MSFAFNILNNELPIDIDKLIDIVKSYKTDIRCRSITYGSNSCIYIWDGSYSYYGIQSLYELKTIPDEFLYIENNTVKYAIFKDECSDDSEEYYIKLLNMLGLSNCIFNIEDNYLKLEKGEA